MCLEFLKARVDLHYICIIFSYDPIFIMLSTIPYTALFSPTPIFSSSSIAFFMFWPWPPIYVEAHTILYTLHSIPYTALLGPIPIFSSSSIAFLIFWPSPLIYVKDRPYLTLHSLHSSPPTFTLQTPVLNLTSIFSSYSSSFIAFFLFWPLCGNSYLVGFFGGISWSCFHFSMFFVGKFYGIMIQRSYNTSKLKYTGSGTGRIETKGIGPTGGSFYWY